MPALQAAAFEWLRSHHLTISTSALSSCGVSVDQRELLVESGALVRIIDDAYTLGGVTVDTLGRCAAVTTARPHLVIAGPTAAQLWDIYFDDRDRRIHAIGPAARTPCAARWLRVYHTDLLDPADIVVRRDGIRLTSIARTTVDMTRYVSPSVLATVIERALSRGCTTEQLWLLTDSLNTRGRPWVRRFARVLAGRHAGAPSESDGERAVLDALVARGVSGLVKQFKIDLPGYGPARFDLAIPGLRWAFEADLHPSHATDAGIANDNERDACAGLLGWTVRRAGTHELSRRNFDATLDRVANEIASHRQPHRNAM